MHCFGGVLISFHIADSNAIGQLVRFTNTPDPNSMHNGLSRKRVCHYMSLMSFDKKSPVRMALVCVSLYPPARNSIVDLSSHPSPGSRPPLEQLADLADLGVSVFMFFGKGLADNNNLCTVTRWPISSTVATK